MNGLHSLVPPDGVLLPFVLEGAALPEEARRRFEQYETCQRPLAMLLMALKAKDPQLYAHSQRVLRFTSRLTRVLHLQQAEATTIERAALFHDVGKLAIHTELLDKAAALTHSEFELIRRHPAYGASILEKMGMPNRVTHVVYHHHEHWDGSGYPRGLQGEAIPLGARIVAIADAWDVMTSHRPYQGLARRKAEGKKLGRPTGSRSQTSKLTGKEPDIDQLLRSGVSQAAIARLLGVNRHTIEHYVKSRR